MKRKLRKAKKEFNFYAFQVKHGFKDYQGLADLLTPSLYSRWKYLGYSEENRTYLFTTKYKEKKQDYRELDEMALYQYIGQHSIDFILDNAMCLNLKCETTNNKIRYV